MLRLVTSAPTEARAVGPRKNALIETEVTTKLVAAHPAAGQSCGPPGWRWGCRAGVLAPTAARTVARWPSSPRTIVPKWNTPGYF